MDGFDDRIGKERTGITAVADDVPYNGRRNGSVFGFTGQEDGLNGWIHGPVGICDGFLVFKITDIPDPAKDKFCTDFLAKVNREALVYSSFHGGLALKNIIDPLQPLFRAKHRRFRRIDTYTNNDLVKQRNCPLNNIHMTKGHRVKGSGEQADSLHEGKIEKIIQQFHAAQPKDTRRPYAPLRRFLPVGG